MNLNFLLIAHQKGPYKNNAKITENDFTNLDDVIKEKLLFIRYFDALEFKQLRSHISLKSYLRKESISFISGSDCHNWDWYPMNTKSQLNQHENNIVAQSIKRYEYSYLKCDSTFEGLKIALTGDLDSRIYLAEPNVEDRKYLTHFHVKLKDKPIDIPLSYGINAVIGNNTSGKTLMLNTIFDEFNSDGNGEPFCDKYNFWPGKTKMEDFNFEFVHQGEIVDKFSKDRELEKEFQGKFVDIDYSEFDRIVNESASRLLKIIKHNTDKLNARNGLNIDIALPSKKLKPYQLVITSKPTQVTISNIRLITQIRTAFDSVYKLYPSVKKIFYKEIISTLEKILKIYKHYTDKIIVNYKSKAIIDAFRQGILDYNNLTREEENQYSDTNQFLNVNDSTLRIYDNFVDLLKLNKIKTEKPIISDLKYKPNDSINPEGDFKFIKSSNVTLDEDTMRKMLKSPFKSSNDYDSILEMTVEKAIESLVGNSTDIVNASALNERYMALLRRQISNEYRGVKLSIVDNEQGLKSQSPGKNAITYLKLKHISNAEDIYIIDQPEDQIGPSDIREKLKPILRKLASKSQVIIITHNPYLVVNLDVDNVIQLDNTSGDMKINFGALYHKENGNMIDIIANSLEGGYDAIKERIDRYERTSN